MYGKFKYFSINPEGGFNEGHLNNVATDRLESSNDDSAVFYSLSFDSHEKGNVWHKIRVFAEASEGMHYEIDYFASDDKAFIETRDIDLYMLDLSIDKNKKEKELEDLWSRIINLNQNKLGKKGRPSLVNVEDALFIGAVGRYLWLRIKFSEKKEKEDHLLINKIRIYYPRMSFLSYLPEVYQEDKESRDFLERFLSIFSTIHDEMEEKIDNIYKYFDNDYVDGDYLKWLSSWLSISADDRWEKEALRRLLKKAPEIYKIRGTKRAIEEMIEIFTGEKPKIIEYFQYRKDLEDSQKGRVLKKLYGNDPYTFTVLVKSEYVKENYRKVAIKKILDEEKPAYTEAKLVILRNNLELDGHTYIGENTEFSKESGMLLDPERSILYYNILEDNSEEGQK